jgi:hypothetical protein
MAIAKKPNRSTTNTQPADPGKAAEAFIAGAGGAPEQADVRKTPVMIRFDRDLLDRIDVAAKRRGIAAVPRCSTRSAAPSTLGTGERRPETCRS